MYFADSFIESTRRLDQEGARVWDFIARFRSNPKHPGLNLERVVRSRDKNLWSARVSQNLRAIVHKDGDIWSLLYVGQHDDAYDWARRRHLERHGRRRHG